MSDLTGSQLIAQCLPRLREAGVADAPRDARRLMAHALGVETNRLTLVLPEPVSDDAAARFEEAITRRVNREPVSHIIGERAFYGRDFAVSADVLDPRPETELLVSEGLSVPFSNVLDLGTGSGCILLTLLAERHDATGVGVDASEAALKVAGRNAVRLTLTNRATFLTSNWFDTVEGRFDLIVSNPPYIALDEMDGLSREVRDHEPHMALTDFGDGLAAYRAIVAGAPNHLEPNGWLMVEIGPTQGAAVSELFGAAGFSEVSVLPDLDGRDRVVRGKFQ